ncbi:FAD-dependent monooxygenase [Chitinophaga sp.]|uniref:FAD-dependent monooxygenase n=1 Tax=Chitinophaga sp. TaxID=1869181 RepID=UPI0031D7C54B
MKKEVLISGASIAGLTLAYWMNRYGYRVTVVEIAKGLRRGGAPIDVRGNALQVAAEMGILNKIKAKEFVHIDRMVNAQNETLATFNVNAQEEYRGDIEIHRDDLSDILLGCIPAGEVTFLFENRIEKLAQHNDRVAVSFKTGETRNFDFVFGADGTHSSVRKLVFGEEEQFSKFFGAYFAIVEATDIAHESGGSVYHEPGKMAALYQFKHVVNAFVVFRSPKLDYDYRNDQQHKEILKENFEGSAWRIPEILHTMVNADNLYFDEVCQIHMPTWSKGRVALVGDAAHTASFPTGMGTSLAMEGAYILAKQLHQEENYHTAFAKYDETYRPYVKEVQSRITRGLNWLVPTTVEGIQGAIQQVAEQRLGENI